MSYSIRELSGKSWHEWPQTQLVEDMDALSPSPQTTSSGCSTNPTPTSSRSHSPKPSHHYPHDIDVMKLPRKDMHLFGQSPVHEDFVLVVCDLCQLAVKLEAFPSHVRLRHQKAGHGGRGAGGGMKNFSSIDLLKTEDLFSLSTKPSVLAPPIPNANVTPVVEVTAPPVPNIEPDDVAMDIGEPLEAATTSIKLEDHTVVKKEEPAEPMIEDNNVISIPDSEPLPPLSNDLMAMMGETSSISASATSAVATAPPTPVVTPTGEGLRLQIKSEPNEPTSSNTTTVVLTPSMTKKVSPLKISPIITTASGISSGGGVITNVGGGGRDRKPLREYHPDKHCGVWDVDTKRHCTRALTCKSHSVVLKRKIEGRSRPFDELVAAHKKAQAEANAKASSPIVTPSPIQVRSFTPTVSVTAPPSVASVRTYSSPILTATTPSKELEESLHYTNDHPRPLAICGFGGGRRVGGLIVNGRNHIFTRKLVRVAITAGSASSFGGGQFHRIRPRVFIAGGAAVSAIESPQSSPYVLNYNLSGNIKRPAGSTAGGLNLTTLPPGGVVIPESFKTDIQDFKGGIKFELGRKIKHILPSGNEVTK